MTALWTSPGIRRAIARKCDSPAARDIVVPQGIKTDIAIAWDDSDA